MEISNILGKLRSDSKSKPTPFLALTLTDELVQAAVWQVQAGQTAVIAVGSPVEWDGADNDKSEFLTSCDATISSAIEGLDEEPSEIIFGVADNWTNQEGILPPKLELIKHLSKELELKPLGFVVVSDSLIRYLRLQEGTPTTSILIQITKDLVHLAIIKLGKIEGKESIAKSDDLASDVEEGLSRLADDNPLPSRIIVFNSMHNLDEIVQNLTSFDWKSKFNFLHIPKIESLPKDVVIRSVAIAGGSEVAKAIGFEIHEPLPIKDEELKVSPPAPTEVPDSPSPANLEDDNILLASAEDFGFTTANTPEPEVSPPTSDPSPVTVDPPTPTKKKHRPFKFKKISPPHISLPRFKFHGPKSLVLIPVGAIVILGAIFSAIWLVPKAIVELYIETKSLEEEVNLTLSTEVSSIDLENTTIPASLVEKTVTGEDSIETTGTKIIGDLAEGEVVIYNRTSLPKTFLKDTVLAYGKLKFALVDDVSVASKSAGIDYVDVPGKATTKIVAVSIGAESNLPAGSELVIGSFTKETYVAKNESALSGGSSEEVRVVDKEDLASLKDSLVKKLETSAQAELESTLGDDSGIYILGGGSKITSESYSSELGSPADLLTLTLTINAKGLSYKKHDIEELVASTLEKAIPPGYVRTDSLPVIELNEVKSESENTLTAASKVTVELLPIVDKTSVALSLKGQSSSNVETALSGLAGLKNANVSITPLWLPPRFKRLPKNPNNITVLIRST
ncbi:MAG: hypothetical protein UY18_C0001G0006 [Microgenomates group bacterium GW2011_GWF2_47_9]|nr:MAG: hypothetical protein UY18_C0001G0006 [Microgenomates group bacterium GW2011_GWF2_47_9]